MLTENFPNYTFDLLFKADFAVWRSMSAICILWLASHELGKS